MTIVAPYVAAFEFDRRSAEYYLGYLRVDQQIGCMQGGLDETPLFLFSAATKALLSKIYVHFYFWRPA